MTTLNDLARSDPNLANNPYLRNMSSQSNSNNNSRAKNKKKSSHCVNPNNQWVIDLLQQKSKKQSGHKQYHQNAYTKAIKNIKKYPFKITNEHNAQEIDGVGPSMAKLIKSKLLQRDEYISQDTNQQSFNARHEIEKQNKNIQKAAKSKTKKNTNKRKKTNKQNRAYIPRIRTGGWALLVHMYDMYKNNDIQGFLKQQLLTDAQQYCDSSFTEAKNKHYTAWKSMTKLIEVEYVTKINRGTCEYRLTPAGLSVAQRLHALMNGDTIPPKPDQSIFDNNNNNNNNDICMQNDDNKVNKPTFICEYCDKVYHQKGWYEKHVNEKHKNKNKNDKKEIDCNEDMMELDDDIELMPKRQRVDNDNDNDSINIDVKKPIKIGAEWYRLYLVYDTSEERRKNRNERVKLENEFNKKENINNKPYRLPIGDFCWTLKNINNNIEYLYPIIVERKRMDDLAKSIQDKRYIEQKWRIKKNLPCFRHIYLIEHFTVNDEMKKRLATALVNTCVRDHFLVYHTKSLIESIRCLAKWTHLIYKQILMKLKKINYNYNFFRDEKCLLFDKFTALIDVKKNLNIPAKIMFGRQLMGINGVTDIIASQIVLKYPTMRNLYIAYNNCDDEEDEKLLLYNQVNGTCLEWHRDLDSGMIELDEDLRNVCAAMDNTKFKPISKNLSEKIWNAFYCDVQ